MGPAAFIVWRYTGPMKRLAALLATALLAGAALARDVTLTILHHNDIHARVEPTMIKGQPYGGVARIGTLVAQLRSTEPNPVLLNAGDTFQGTLYFQAYTGQADLFFMNRIGYQAMAPGNHEFDKGPAAFSAFIDKADFPLVSANLDVSDEPALRGKIPPFTILMVGGEKLGVIGATTEDTPSISSPGPNVRFKPVRASVLAAVRALESQGVDKIVLLSHLGYGEDVRIARELDGVDVVVGGHSHTLLGAFEREGIPSSSGTYPTVVKSPNGDTVLVVQAWEWGKVLGKLRVTFDGKGRVRSWAGSQPILVDKSIPEDPFLSAMVARFQKPINALRGSVVGETKTLLDGSRGAAGRGTAMMADVLTDAFMAATRNSGPVAAFVNAGGVRASIEPGPITFEQAITVQPFGNTLCLLDLTGAELLAALEHGVAGLPEGGGGMLFPSAGLAYTVDVAKLPGQRVVSATLGGAPIDPAKTYRCVFGSFVAGGGDGHEVLKNAKGARLDTGLLDVDALVAYLRANSPLNVQPGTRLSFVKE